MEHRGKTTFDVACNKMLLRVYSNLPPKHEQNNFFPVKIDSRVDFYFAELQCDSYLNFRFIISFKYLRLLCSFFLMNFVL